MQLEFFDDKNKSFKSIKMPIKGTVSKHCILTNSRIIKLTDNYNKYFLN